MYRPRIIPVLLIDASGHAVKTIHFRKKIDLGDPVNAVSIFNAFRVDELVLLEISATARGSLVSLDLLEDVAAEAKMPFSVGGGISTLTDIRQILSKGAEKVVISTAAIENPRFLRAAADQFGSSSIVVCMDVQRDIFGRPTVRTRGGTTKSGHTPVEAALLLEEMGAGEIIVQSIDRDGMMDGYDIACVNEVARAVSVPVIALGGAGRLAHMTEAYSQTCASAFASGSMFCFQDKSRGVLISYPSVQELRSFHGMR